MSVKIFKEEFIKIFKQVFIMLITVVGIALVCGCLVKILEKGKPGDIKSVLYMTFRDIIPSAITIISAICAFTVYERFNKSVNSDEAYLTFTLPATMRQQIKGRYFALLLWLAIVCVVAYLSNYIFVMIISIGETYSEYEQTTHTVTVDEVLTEIELILIAVTAFTSGVMQVFFCTVWGGILAHKHKRGVSTLIFFGIVFVETIIFVVGFIYGLDFAFTNDNRVLEHILGFCISIVIGGIGVLFAFLSEYLLKRKLNVV